jgi:hypothetical protein
METENTKILNIQITHYKELYIGNDLLQCNAYIVD